MKLINKLTAALMVLPMVAAITACSDEHAEYASPEALANAQVYFPTTNQSTVGLTVDETSFDVTIARVKTEGELVVPITATMNEGEESLLQIPASVTFADGQNEATLTVTYDPADFQYDEEHPVTLAIGDKEVQTPYGITSYEFTAVMSAPWTPWCTTPAQFENAGGQNWPFGSVCTGTFTYAQMMEGDDPGLPVAIRQSTVNPSTIQIKIGNWFYGVDLLLDGEWSEKYQVYFLTIAPQWTGYYAENYSENVMVTDYVNYWKNIRKADGAEVLTYDPESDYGWPNAYNPETGTMEIAVVYYISAGVFGQGYETFQMDGYYVPDYSVEATYAGVMKNANEEWSAVVDFEMGADVAKAKYTMVDAKYDDQTIAGAIVEDQVESVEITEGGRVYLPLSEDGKFRVVIVSYDEEDEPKELSSCVFEFEKGGSSWESLGIGCYTDDIVASLYQQDPITYEVEVLGSTKTPGLYRVVYPYGEVYPFNEEGDYDNSTTYYMEINAEDPDGVYMAQQETGCDWGYGNMKIMSMGWYYMQKGESYEEIKKRGIFGNLKDGIITFPVKGLVVSDKDGDYYANPNGAFELILPDTYAAMVKAHKAPQLQKKHRTIAHRRNRSAMQHVSTKVNKKMMHQKVTKKVSTFKAPVVK